ncbi:hypothetical protein D3C71_1401480 [compost metagenome]
MRVFKEDRPLAAMLQYAVGNLRVAAQRATLEALDPLLLARPATAPRHLVQALAGGAGTNAFGELRQHIEMRGGEIEHLWLACVMCDQRQRLFAEIIEIVGAGIRCEAGMDALHLDPVARGGNGRDEGLAVDHALTLERDGLGEDGRRVDRVDQIDGAIQRALRRAHADHFGHQLHQSAFAAIGVTLQGRVVGQRAGGGDGIEGAAHRMQLHAQLADTALAGTQPAEQRGVGALMVQMVGGQADAHRDSPWVVG